MATTDNNSNRIGDKDGGNRRGGGAASSITLGIPICSCLLVSPPSDPDLVRPYTPISSRHQRDSFELLIKHYPGGEMTGSRYFKKLKRGQSMVFRQIPKNVKELVSFLSFEFLLLVFGT